MPPHRRAPIRWAWAGLAYASLAVGLIGIVLPVLPTTPFLLLAAFAADRASPRLHAWLLGHRWFGEPIRNWQSSRSIARRAKVTAVSVMSISVVIMLVSAPRVLAVPASIVVAIVAVWILTRPEPARPPGASPR